MKNRFTNLYRGMALTLLLAAGSLTARAQNVGIGTTAPDASAALDIVASAKGALLPRVTAAGRAGIPSPATGLIVFQTDGTSGFYYNSGTPGAPVWQQLATAAGTATGFIQNQNAADQVANFRISGTGTASSLQANGTSAIGTQGAFLQWNRTGFEGETWLLNQFGGAAAQPHGIRFGESTTANVVTEFARFIGNGSFGLGTTAPTARLHARGTGNAFPATTGTAQSAGLISRFQTSDNAILDLGGNSGNGFWLQSTDITTLALNYPLLLNPNGGNVGIGTTTPAQKLDVVGNIQSSANIAVDYTNANAGTVANTLRFGPTNSGEAIGSKRTAGGNQFGLDFYTTSTNRMSITTGGNVGIGTSTPSALLDVNGSTRLRGLTTAGVVTNAADGTLSTATAASLDATTASNGLTETGTNIALGGTLTGATSIANAGFALNVTGTGTSSFGGNVGIGTTAPVAGLHVDRPQAPSASGLGVILSGGTSGNPSIELRGNGAVPFIDFVETVGIDNSTRLISQSGTLNVQTSVANTAALSVNGFTELAGVNAAAAPAIATAKVASTMPTGASSQTTVALPTGIVGTKVLSLTAMAYDGAATPSAYPPNNGITNVAVGVAYQVYLFNNSIIINTGSGTTSSGLFGKAVNVLITYEQ